ncbi:hypothetical protein TNIN_135491 [Trichonephila inaurata madagascariensis]|uniref:Uncharacterized protein n=1 Tax=Trichonephila inaurata madagascariensis TaxID=2747483 RepID=A0A8X7BW25_9ARAC|nr:hypothetical protein TNIN_135491 [Trichonephila inaurata madagascariensis]
MFYSSVLFGSTHKTGVTMTTYGRRDWTRWPTPLYFDSSLCLGAGCRRKKLIRQGSDSKVCQFPSHVATTSDFEAIVKRFVQQQFVFN